MTERDFGNLVNLAAVAELHREEADFRNDASDVNKILNSKEEGKETNGGFVILKSERNANLFGDAIIQIREHKTEREYTRESAKAKIERIIEEKAGTSEGDSIKEIYISLYPDTA